MLLDAGVETTVGVAVVIVLTLYVLDQHFLAPQHPSPAVYYTPKQKAKLGLGIKTRLQLYLDCASMYKSAWQKHAKHGTSHAILLPSLGVHTDAILPHTSMPWVLSQPDTALSSYDAIVELNQVMYSLGHARYIQDPWQGHLVRGKLFSAFESMAAELAEELVCALDEHFGTDTGEWKEVPLVETVSKITARMAGRLTVGLPLCRNEEYVDACCDAVDDFMIVAGVVRAMPHILRPLVGSAMGWWYRSRIERTKALLEPLYRKRVAGILRGRDQMGDDEEEPKDYVQLMLRYAAEHRPDEFTSLDIMTRRLIIANFGTIHQPSLLIANTLLNIIASDKNFDTIKTLKDELTDVFASTLEDPTESWDWTRANINRHEKADSLMRETTRMHTFGSRALLRKVVAKDGVTTDTGIHIPHGRCVSFLAHPVHMDEDIFAAPDVFDPFRFHRMRKAEVDQAARAGPLRFATTSPTHLTFGHGRHACPGRFLVDFQLKMVIAHVITRYDLSFPESYAGKRPENVWTADVKLPQQARIRIRRRRVQCK
ncbi:putative cytochrome P450 [Cercophora newfieldiana]|uniref:Cytochrome P450 n=1 Tax=Cercophora newfieldiana TaxID=92897 RepID=A0AA40CJL3_9PEZI|nr:putative cytochrome P450 [Cercophora newfieldiana]